MKNKMKSCLRATIVAAAAMCGALLSCQSGGWTEAEKKIICEADSVMCVMTMPQDSAVLRTPSVDVSPRDLKSEELKALMAKMYKTVTDPSQDGVGIAAPQVGINRRIIWVQRLDKEGEPFECYVNIRIDSLYGDTTRGREGCLSIPGYWGIVPRRSDVTVTYVNPESGQSLKEHIHGFTAVIFQHECDHLEGILYTDKADSLFADQ